MQVSVFFSSKRSNTKRCAEIISRQCNNANLHNIKDCEVETLLEAELPICGTPTYGMGDIEYSWIAFLNKVSTATIQNRKCMVFALGDQKNHTATFAGSLRTLTQELERIGFTVTGQWPIEDYLVHKSPSLDTNGFFPGLVLDEVNEAHKTKERIETWLKQNKQLNLGTKKLCL